MTTTTTDPSTTRFRCSPSAACWLLWLALAACNGEPYILEGEDLTGDLPDQDIAAIEADRDFEGHELEPFGDDVSNYSPSACTGEEWEAHRKASTMPDGRIREDAPLCPKRRPAAPKSAAPAAK